MDNSDIDKNIWTEHDFDSMGWHDVTVYAIAVLPEQYELRLDIDYILEWIQPVQPESFFRFSVSPATLVFRNVHDLSISIEQPYGPLQIQNIERMNAVVPPNADFIDRDIEWKWVIDLGVGEISLSSIGFNQFIRKKPIVTNRQSLTLDERGGLSFSTGTFET